MIKRALIDFEQGTVTAFLDVTYQHPTRGEVTEEVTESFVEAEKLPQPGWTNEQLCAVVQDVSGIAEPLEVAVPPVRELAPAPALDEPLIVVP